MTPDITVEGRLPSKLEYETSLALLRRIAEREDGLQSLAFSCMPDMEQRLLVEMRRQGLLWQAQRGGFWFHTILSDYGRLYLKERSAP